MLTNKQHQVESAKHPSSNRNVRPMIALAVVSCFHLCCITVADPDLWGHTLYGLRAIDQGVLLESADPFSYTAVAAKWVNHEWLSEYYMGWLYSNLDGFGLWLWRTAWAALLISVLAFRWSKSPRVNVGAATLTLIFSSIALQGFFVYVRPQLATLGLFAVTLEILRRGWSCRQFMERSKALWLLVPIVCIWTNLHGGFVAGVAIIWLFVCGAAVRAASEPTFRPAALRLSVVAIVASWSTVINPYGMQLHTMLWHHLVPHQDVVEWEPLLSTFSLPLLLPLVLFGLACMGLLCDWITHRCMWRLPWMEVAVTGVCLVQALSHRRHVALLTIAVAILLAEPLSRFVRSCFRNASEHFQARPKLAAAGFIVVVALFASLRVHWLARIHHQVPICTVSVATEGILPGVPVRAVAFLQQLGLQGNLVTDYGWGQYVLWHLHPQCRVAFDGRYRTIYPSQVERDFLNFYRATADGPRPLRLLTEYPTDIALLPQDWPVVTRLQNDVNWQRVYEDHQAVVFVHQRRFTTELQWEVARLTKRPAQVAQWVSFPAGGCQDTLTKRCSDRKQVSTTKRFGRSESIVSSTPGLARELQSKSETEFIAR